MIADSQWSLQLEMAPHLLAAVAAGLLVGIERGWRQRGRKDGSRVAGIRTFSLIGTCGGLASLLALHVSPVLGAVLLAAMTVMLLGAFLRPTESKNESRDATTMVAALLTLALGLLAGAGLAILALAGAAITTLILSSRRPIHGIIAGLSETEMRAIARYGVIAIAVLPFLPDAPYGPYDAWNPFKLWLVVVLVTGFSIAGYIANRVIGQSKGTIATAVIGGAYSSTAVTAAFAGQLAKGASGHLGTGIALASAIMYFRVVVLAAALAPQVALQILMLLAPAMVVAFSLCALLWRLEQNTDCAQEQPLARPFELLPAFGFMVAVALASLLVHWAQTRFGEEGAAISLFIAGSFDVDAAIITYSVLPEGGVSIANAALALCGTVAVNMAFKTAIVFANAGPRAGRAAGLALLASFLVLSATLGARAVMLFG